MASSMRPGRRRVYRIASGNTVIDPLTARRWKGWPPGPAEDPAEQHAARRDHHGHEPADAPEPGPRQALFAAQDILKSADPAQLALVDGALAQEKDNAIKGLLGAARARDGAEIGPFCRGEEGGDRDGGPRAATVTR